MRVILVDGDGIVVKDIIKFQFGLQGGVFIIFKDTKGNLRVIDIRDVVEIQVA